MADASNELYKKGHSLQIMHVPTGKIVEFKAFVTDFADNYNSNWNSQSVYGRMDPIATFQGTTREIKVSWTVPSHSNEEAKLNLQKASLLFSMLYPAYEPSAVGRSSAGQISAAPLLKIKFANLICSVTDGEKGVGVREAGLLGFVNGGVSLQPNFAQGFHDPGFGELYPLSYSLSLSFTVLHTHKLGWQGGSSGGESRLTETNNAKAKQFPYGSPYPKKSTNIVNDPADSDAKVNPENSGGTTHSPEEDNPDPKPGDIKSGLVDEKTGKPIPASAAAPERVPNNPGAVEQALEDCALKATQSEPFFLEEGGFEKVKDTCG
jgi:hypothetical protein